MVKDELIDKYRDINVGDDYWYECIKDDLNGDLELQGFRLDQMYFSGFSSQGDGACFTGRMVDWKAFCAKVPQFVADFPNTAIFLQDEGGSYTITHSGRYYHQYSTNHEYDADIENQVDLLSLVTDALPQDGIEADMRLAIYKAALEEGDVGDWLKDYFRGLMADLYSTLGKKHDYFTSDEVVWETIEANELDKELDEEDEDDAELVGTLADSHA
jgi:hypothetical protein